jgi:hypothetical protein
MNYATLQEAYNVDSFDRKSRPSQKPNKNSCSGNGSLGGGGSGGQPSYVESSKLSLSSNKLNTTGVAGVADFPNNRGSSCSPLQAPNYNIPISNECKKEHDEAMNVYMNANNNINNMMNNIPTGLTGSSAKNNMNNIEMLSQQDQSVNAANTSSTTSTFAANTANASPIANAANAANAASANSTNLFNSLKSSNDNVAPYYDEDLEQYFNIADLNDEVKYNSGSRTNAYMPNSNKHPYTNNDTAEYSNTNTVIKNGNNLLNNSSYNLTPEEKKSAEDAILFLKSIEDKINKGEMNASGFHKSSIADPVVPTINTGPGGFKVQEKPEDKPLNINNYIYNAIFNISILLIIGIAIIILCDQMVELSIQIGMKRVVNILEPFIKAQAAHAAAAARAAQAAAQSAHESALAAQDAAS